MKCYKKIVSMLGIVIILTEANCFATVPINETKTIENDVEYIYRNYEVPESEDIGFLNTIEKEFTIDKKQYVLDSTDKTGGNEIEFIDIKTTKTIETDSNKQEDILSELPTEMEYKENGYVGKYFINPNNMKIETIYNGYSEYLIEENKKYTGLPTNDLINIPKQIVKNGVKLDLLKTEWEITKTIDVGENKIPNEYTAHCYYASKTRVDNPLSYTVTAEYFGTAEKTLEKPFKYSVVYKEIPEETNYLPYIIGSSGGLTIILLGYIFRRNIKIYNLQNGNWKLIHKSYIRKSTIKLDNCTYKSKTNKYKIELSKQIANKLDGKMITIIRGNNSITRLINKNNYIDPVVIEVSI